ncbi:MAG: TetR/AcrR family transcriptional regulator [Chloroflexi bacterium]|nr:TetR/AcrR family transcriptional regulator [Chloroflexota bacterium]MCH8009730.1 TetR/AcrR family transcriptional regulator [Chloroflexota bacterium]
MVENKLLSGEEAVTERTGRWHVIRDAATELFAERGFARVSVQEIADVAQTHKTTVLYHFETKEALYGAVLDEALGRIAEVMREFLASGFAGEGMRERMAYMLDQIHAHFAQHPAHARLLEWELLEIAAPNVYFEHFVERIYLPAVKSIEKAVAMGVIRPVDPALFIHDLHVELIGYFCHRSLIERMKPGDAFSTEALIARRNHLLDQIFYVLRPSGAELPS